MAEDYREDEDLLDFDADENRIANLDPDAAPAPIGVYDRPEGRSGGGLSLAAIIGILALLVIAYFVLTALF